MCLHMIHEERSNTAYQTHPCSKPNCKSYTSLPLIGFPHQFQSGGWKQILGKYAIYALGFDTQNMCLPRPVQATRVFPTPVFLPRDPISGAWFPHLLYRPQGFLFSLTHGDFVTRYIILAQPGSQNGVVHLSPERIYF